MSPVNTAYQNVGAPPIAALSQFTVALTAQTVPNSSTSGAGNPSGVVESSFSIPARLLPINKTGGSYLNTGALIMVAPDSALSTAVSYCAYIVPATNTVTLRFTNASNTTAVQRAATWGFGIFQRLP